MRIVLISDNPIDFIGGAELQVKILKEELNCEFVQTSIFNQTLSRYADADLFIVSNYYDMNQDAVDFLKERKYVTWQNDFLFCTTRRPDIWTGCIVPEKYLRNIDLIQNAKINITHSTLQTEIFKKNVEANYYNLKGNLWKEEDFDLMAILKYDEKNGRAFVIDSQNPLKGTAASENFCRRHKIAFDSVGKMEYRDFLTELSGYSLYVGLSDLESFGRVHCESAMMGVIPIGNDNIGFMSDYDGQFDHLLVSMYGKREELFNLIRSYL